MATLFPDPLPQHIVADPLRKAERTVYEALRDQLDDSWTVFYSRPWLGLDRQGREVDGEADFVVAHPEAGFLVIEVKGGAIDRDARRDAWTSTDGSGVIHPIKNPVNQASRNKYHLIEKLRGSTAWNSRFVRAVHGVILPACETPRWDLGAEMPLEIFAFQSDMGRLGAWCEDRLRFSSPPDGSPEHPLGTDGLRALELLLARSFHLRSPLQSRLTDEERTLYVLTEQQYHILEGLEDQNRCAVLGGAGTGKTLLAAEKAGRLATGGISTLLACYNRPLAFFLRSGLGHGPDRPVVMTFHELCADLVRRAGADADRPPGMNSSVYFEEHLPDLAFDALSSMPESPYQAVVVDEAQDFRDGWWSLLDLLPRAGDPSSTLYAFLDDNQQLYESTASRLLSTFAVTYKLTRNLRNTRQIFDSTAPFYRGVTHQAAGPEGRPPEWVHIDTPADLNRKLGEVLGRLTVTEQIPPEDIAVLTGSNTAEAAMIRSALSSKYEVTDAERISETAVVVDTVRRFKGLERPVVVLTHLEHMKGRPELAYVGISRGQVHVIGVGVIPLDEPMVRLAAQSNQEKS